METEDPCHKHFPPSAKQCSDSQVRKVPSLYMLLENLVQLLADEKVWVCGLEMSMQRRDNKKQYKYGKQRICGFSAFALKVQ